MSDKVVETSIRGKALCIFPSWDLLCYRGGVFTSSVMVHFDKGQKAIGALRDQAVWKQVDARQVAAGNPSMVKSCERSPWRDMFMQEMDGTLMQRLGKKYLKRTSFKTRVMAKVKKCVPAQLRKMLKRLLSLMRQRVCHD